MPGYGSDSGLTDWLAGMGYTLPGTAPTAAVLRQRGSSWLDGVYERLWTGTRTDGVEQDRAWPRTGARVACTQPIATDVVPLPVIHASYRAAWLEASSPGILGVGITPGQRVSREKVDVIEVTYHNDDPAKLGMGGIGYLDSEIDGAMRSFICNDDDSGRFFLRAVGS